MSRALSWRAEAARQLRRRRTAWAFGLLLALPVIIVVAFALGDDGGPADPTPRFVDLATSGAANFTVFTLFVSADLLLVILAALFVGDPVPAEASWGSLRYLLVAPVPRTRLLTSKLVVGLATTALAVLLLALWSLGVGGLAYGWGAFTSPLGGSLSWEEFLLRLAVVLGYVFVTVAQIAAVALALGVLNDAPLAAVGGAVLVAIVASILDAIDTLGTLRNGLPLHYSRAWTELLSTTVAWGDLRRGVLWSLLWSLVFLAFAYRHFGRKDILS